jgi:hypothetical protein
MLVAQPLYIAGREVQKLSGLAVVEQDLHCSFRYTLRLVRDSYRVDREVPYVPHLNYLCPYTTVTDAKDRSRHSRHLYCRISATGVDVGLATYDIGVIFTRPKAPLSQVLFPSNNIEPAPPGFTVLFQHANFEYDLRDFRLVLESLIDGRADIVYGSRFLSDPTE